MSWAKDHLSEAQRRDIAEGCFTVQEVKGDELHGLCPAHDDHAASFSYNIGKDTCFCFACGFKGDIIALWGHCVGIVDVKDRFKAFRDRFADGVPATGRGAKRREGEGRGERSATEPEPTQIIAEADWQQLRPLDEAWRSRCREEFGWSDAVVDRFDLRLRSIGRDVRLCIPVRQDDGALVNVRCYLPGAGDSKMISWGKGFGKAKLLPSPQAWSDDAPLLLCEGEKDCLAALSHGFNAVTSTGGATAWPDDRFSRYFAGRDVVIAYDHDEAGRDGAERVAKALCKWAERVRVVQWPSFMADKDDVADWFVKHGKSAEELRALIVDAKEVKGKPASERSRSARASEIPAEIQRFFIGKQFKPRLAADEVLRERRIAHDPRTGQVFQWNGRMWEETHETTIRHLVLSMLGQEGKSQLVSDVVRIVTDLSVIRNGRAFNDRPNMLPLQNGMFCLQSGELAAHDVDNLNTYCLDVALKLGKDKGKCPVFSQFMIDFVKDEATRREVLKFAAYTLTRETKHEKALFLVGPGGDGKSTFIDVLETLLGEINVSNVSLGALEDQFQRVMLKDKLLNVSTEVEGGLLQSPMFKAVVSGDRVSASYKHRDAFSFKPVAKHIFACNRLPTIQDTSRGLLRRMMVVETERSFTTVDKDLRGKLHQELDGIFLMLIRHLQMLVEDGGFRDDEIPYMIDCKERFAEANNPVISFANQHLDIGKDLRSETMGVYETYVKFCAKRGYKAKSEQHFGRELKALYKVNRVRSGSGKRLYFYEGMGLVDDLA